MCPYVKPGLGPGRSHAPRVVKKTSRRGALVQLCEERCRAQMRTRAGPRGRRAARRGALALLGATLLFALGASFGTPGGPARALSLRGVVGDPPPSLPPATAVAEIQ
jgi:hypothetical protein